MTGLETLLRELSDSLVAAHERIADLEGRLERMWRPGTVTDVDAAQQLYRHQIGVDDQGQPVKSDWIPYGQHAGDHKEHIAPSVGQQMMMISPDGDHSQAFGVPFTWSNANASPSTRSDESVRLRGDVKVTQRGDKHMTDTKPTGGGHFILATGAVVTKIPDPSKIKFVVGDPNNNPQWFALDPSVLLPCDKEDIS
ncbi:phage baseplate assembly protein V [Methylovirgula sp. 4M-Z18]|uniref:phage baseplate assembly protein V n=1 Tax=Methylovirgula sp. 4M-Z18 TaxID=2293567 RepID=UPI000E2F0698|nr:phage baseplate assembly protein V [Methylovirgula sp. 4M-Z18]RFB80403.1 hypothetical protein DYH55_02425 [Methylovirgula sp. 4M-Z18]